MKRVCSIFHIAAALLLAAGGVRGQPDPFAAQLPVVAPEKILRFGVDDDNLVIETDVDVAAGEQVFRLQGLSGEAVMQAYARTRQRQPGASISFTFSHATAPQPDGARTVTSMQLRTGYVGMTRSATTAQERSSVTFSQSRYRRRGEGDTQVSLQIRSIRRADDEVLVNSYLSASNLSELMREHPLECAQYLAPIFRDFRQEAAVFGVSAEVAGQVFADALPHADNVAQQVDAAVQRLDNANFRTREAAAQQLKQMGTGAVRLLHERPKYYFTPEQNARLDSFLSAFDTLSAERIAQMRSDQDFLMRCVIYSDDPAVRQAARDELSRQMGKPLAMDISADRAGRAAAVAKLRNDESPKTAQ